jgi:hypothetical protein
MPKTPATARYTTKGIGKKQKFVRPCGLCSMSVTYTKTIQGNLTRWETLYALEAHTIPLLCVGCWQKNNTDYVNDLITCAKTEEKGGPATNILINTLGVSYNDNTTRNKGFAVLTHVPTHQQRTQIYDCLRSRGHQLSQVEVDQMMSCREKLISLWITTRFARASPCLMSFQDLDSFTRSIFEFTLNPRFDDVLRAATNKEADISIQRLIPPPSCQTNSSHSEFHSTGNWGTHWNEKLNKVCAGSIVEWFQTYLPSQCNSEQAPTLSLNMEKGPEVTYSVSSKTRRKTKFGSKKHAQVVERTGSCFLANAKCSVLTNDLSGSGKNTTMKMLYKLLLRNNGYVAGDLRSKGNPLPVLDPCSGTVSDDSSGLSSILSYLAIGDKPSRCKASRFRGEKRKREAEGKLPVPSVHVPLLSVSWWQGKVMPMDTPYCHVCYARHVRGPRMELQGQGHPDRCVCDEMEGMIVGALHIVRARTPYKDPTTGCLLVSAHQVPLDLSILVHASVHRPIYIIHSTRRWSPSDARSP